MSLTEPPCPASAPQARAALPRRALHASIALAFHFYRLGPAGWRPLWDDWRRPAARDALRVPPALLRFRVHGALDRGTFVRAGELVSSDLRSALEAQGRPLASFSDALDFGCGCGRVLRWLAPGAPASRYVGTDIDPEAIAWCRAQLPIASFSVNDSLPPLGFPDASFDLVYSISVFTHLDEDTQRAWLAELRRVAKPGALVLLSTHGRPALGRLSEAEQRFVAREGFLFRSKPGTGGRLHLERLPGLDPTAYQSQEWVQQNWCRGFRIRDYREGGIAGHQDLVVLERD